MLTGKGPPWLLELDKNPWLFIFQHRSFCESLKSSSPHHGLIPRHYEHGIYIGKAHTPNSQGLSGPKFGINPAQGSPPPSSLASFQSSWPHYSTLHEHEQNVQQLISQEVGHSRFCGSHKPRTIFSQDPGGTLCTPKTVEGAETLNAHNNIQKKKKKIG